MSSALIELNQINVIRRNLDSSPYNSPSSRSREAGVGIIFSRGQDEKNEQDIIIMLMTPTKVNS